jgi:hypothetical protein
VMDFVQRHRNHISICPQTKLLLASFRPSPKK